MNAISGGVSGWLSLAATPAFALMALSSAGLGHGPAEMLCSAAHASPLDGMAPMYLLMSAFHSGPWLNLVSDRRLRADSGGLI